AGVLPEITVKISERLLQPKADHLVVGVLRQPALAADSIQSEQQAGPVPPLAAMDVAGIILPAQQLPVCAFDLSCAPRQGANTTVAVENAVLGRQAFLAIRTLGHEGLQIEDGPAAQRAELLEVGRRARRPAAIETRIDLASGKLVQA